MQTKSSNQTLMQVWIIDDETTVIKNSVLKLENKFH